MKNWKIKTFALLSSLSLGSTGITGAQTKTTVVTETYKVAGNCGMCKKTIEAAATKKGAKANWDESKKELRLTYNPGKASSDEILKDVAYAGYDNEKYLAPETAYLKLPDCCQYARSSRAVKSQASTKANGEHAMISQQPGNAMESVYSGYFSLKDALVQADATAASARAKKLTEDLSAVNMGRLEHEQHLAFMKYLTILKADAERMTENKDIVKQREFFTALSQNMYELMKSIQPGYPVYLDHCPMFNGGKGANWISREAAIKNPYYGSQMMTCGKIVETLK